MAFLVDLVTISVSLDLFADRLVSFLIVFSWIKFLEIWPSKCVYELWLVITLLGESPGVSEMESDFITLL